MNRFKWGIGDIELEQDDLLRKMSGNLDNLFETVQYDEEPENWEQITEEEHEEDDELEGTGNDLQEKSNETMIEKSKVAYHTHDGWQEHPVAVEYHDKYFSGESAAKESQTVDEGVLTNLDEIGAWYVEQSSDIDNLLSEEEQSVLKGYVSSDFQNINAFLRNRRPELRGSDTESKHQVQIMKAMAEKWKTPRKLLAYRGTSERRFDYMKIGDIVSDKGFMSVSLSSRVAEKFGSTIFRITVPKNTNAIIGLDSELEIILMPRSRVKITNRIRRGSYLIYDMELIP